MVEKCGAEFGKALNERREEDDQDAPISLFFLISLFF